MSDLRADITALLDRARGQGSKVIAIEALDTVLNPRHRITIHRLGGHDIHHPRVCGGGADCPLAQRLRTAHLLSSPHAKGRTYNVWFDSDGGLRFQEVTDG